MCSWTDHSSYFFNSISSLRLNEVLTDVTITCADKYFQAHKLVLCASSQYFRSILGNNAEKSAIVHIVGVPPVYIHNILQYLYTGQIEITPTDVEPFLRVANDLKICGLCKDDSNSQSISEPDPELVEEPAVDPTVSESNDNVASSVPFMPSLDLSLRTRFKNPIPLDELRFRKRSRGSEATLSNSIPDRDDKLGEPAHQGSMFEYTSRGCREQITVVPDILDADQTDHIRDNKENLTNAGSADSSPGVSPHPVQPTSQIMSVVGDMVRTSPGLIVTSGGNPMPILSVSQPGPDESRRPNLRNSKIDHYFKPSSTSDDTQVTTSIHQSTTCSTNTTTASISIRPNSSLAIDPSLNSVHNTIATRSSNGIHKRKSIPTKFVTPEKRGRYSDPFREDDSSLQSASERASSVSVLSLPASIMSLSASDSSALSTVTSTPTVTSPLSSLTTSSLNSPLLRSSSNPCKGLIPLNCRKGHSGNHCNHVIIPLPDGRKAHYSRQGYEQWLQSN